jgi:hypothetical protein
MKNTNDVPTDNFKAFNEMAERVSFHRKVHDVRNHNVNYDYKLHFLMILFFNSASYIVSNNMINLNNELEKR